MRTISGKTSQHNGCDFVDAQRREITPRGVDIISIADGEVTRVSKDATSGNFVYIRHSGGFESFYAHLRDNSTTVKVGDRVRKEQVIGVMGRTGNVVSSRTDIPIEHRGTHLHFGMRLNGVWIDPIPYLDGRKTIGGSTTLPNPSISNNSSLKANDTVRINATATIYATGQNIPASVKNNTYTIQQISGDRALLREIVSWVFIKDLTLISNNQSSTNSSAPIQTAAPQASNSAIVNGDRVRVRAGSRWHDGTGIAAFIFNQDMWVTSVPNSANTVTISTSKGGAVTGRISVGNLTKI
jgi:hypothetical protein